MIFWKGGRDKKEMLYYLSLLLKLHVYMLQLSLLRPFFHKQDCISTSLKIFFMECFQFSE